MFWLRNKKIIFLLHTLTKGLNLNNNSTLLIQNHISQLKTFYDTFHVYRNFGITYTHRVVVLDILNQNVE